MPVSLRFPKASAVAARRGLSRRPLRQAMNDRATRRFRLSATATAREIGNKTFGVTLIDLSTDGFQLETFADLSRVERIWIRLPGLALRAADIVWKGRERAGGNFDEPLHPAVVRMLVERASS